MVDVETEKKNVQYILDAVRLKLFSLESETQVAFESETSDQEAIALPSTDAAQVEPSEVKATIDKPPCPNCGEAVRIRNNGVPKNKDGYPILQRWRCNHCEKSWTVPIVKTLPQKSHDIEQSWDSRVESFLAEVAPSD